MDKKNKSCVNIIFGSIEAYKRSYQGLFVITSIWILLFFLLSKGINFINEYIYVEGLSYGMYLGIAVRGIAIVLFFSILVFYKSLFFNFVNMTSEGNRADIPVLFKNVFSKFRCCLGVSRFLLFRVFFWSLFLIVPGIVSLLRNSFSTMAVLFDDKKGKEAFVFSRKIFKKTWVKYLDYLLFCLFLLFLSWGIRHIFNSAGIYFVRSNVKMVVNILDWIEGFLFVIIWNFALVYFFCLYKELRSRMLRGEENG